MNTSRIILAAVLGGIAMFVWGAISHMVLPLGEMGMKSLPAEESLVPAMKEAIQERGFYMFPAFGEGHPTDEQMKAWEEKYKAGPRGVIVYDPTGGDAMSPAQLATELASNIIASLLAAIVLARVPGSRGLRTLLACGLGILAWLSIDVSYWNWYRFPTLFTASQFLDQAVGWLGAGAAIAWALGRDSPKAGAAGSR